MRGAIFDFEAINKRLGELENPKPAQEPQSETDEFTKSLQQDWFGMPLIMWAKVD